MTLSDQTVDFLRKRLTRAGISTALVVDDAFDPPTLSSLQNEVDDFWNGIERDDGLYEQLESFGISAESADDITEDAIATLWSRRGESTLLVDLANRTLFVTARSSLEEVERIAASLHELGLEVDRVGTDRPLLRPVAGLVFMDYYLGEPSDPVSSELSTFRAREIYDAAGEGADKPFIILMSSLPDVSSQADRFRDDSDLLGGLFDFVSKDELNDPTRFVLKMASWASNMPLRHKIQNFVEALDSTLCDRTREFMKRAKSLTIEDYAFVQALSLQDDGHPLGDYIQWLLRSLLVNKVLEDNKSFTASKNEINKMSFDPQPPSQLFPSTHLAEIYSIAIAEQKLEDIGRHPRINAKAKETRDADPEGTVEDPSPGDKPSSQEDLPLLRLGDLLVNNDDQRVYMIATPDCDLQFAPGTKRVPDEAESVLLLPGQLLPLRGRRGQIQTELYLHNGDQYRIVWDRKKIITVSISEFLQWCSREGYSRPARIRLPYAVKIQQEVITSFSRVGMPVAPPLQDSVPVEIFSVCIDQTWKPLGQPLESGVTVIHGDRREPSFVVTPAALNDLLDRLRILIDIYTEFVESSQGRTKQELTSKLDRLKRCLRKPENLVLMLEKKHDLPEPGKAKQLMGDTIGLHRSGVFSAGCRNRHVVCLNIVYD